MTDRELILHWDGDWTPPAAKAEVEKELVARGYMPRDHCGAWVPIAIPSRELRDPDEPGHHVP